MGQGRLKGPQSMEVHTKLGVLQHPHPTGCRSSTQSQRAWKALRELAGLDR